MSSIAAAGVRQPSRVEVTTFDTSWLIVGAFALSVFSFVFFYLQGTTLNYYDAGARMLITRRVFDSPTPGFAQLGAVWPPLTHIAALPLIMFEPLYRNGVAGSFISMIAFVISVYYLYQFVLALTGDRWAGLIAVLAFGLNSNILYMQSTPMTEVPMIAAALGAMYYLLKVTQEPDKRRWYLWSGLFLSAGCLIRYENWLLLMAAVPLLIYSFLRLRFSYHRIEGTFIYWAYWAFVGAAVWLAWNWLIFGDPLYFQRGEYADASLWAIESPATDNLPVAFLAYFYACLNTVGPLFFLGVIGGLVYLARTRLRADSVMPYLPLIIFPFFVYMVYAGQRPLRVYEIGETSLYNIRFGLIMVVPAYIFIGYLAARRVWLRSLMVGLVIVGSAAGLFMYNTVTLEEARNFATLPKVQAQVGTGQWLLENYDGRPLVMESYGNDVIQYTSGIPLGNIIYEGSYHMWEDALQNPQDWGEWVIMRRFVEGDDLDADKMWTLHHDNEVFHQYFELVFENGPHSIYQRRDPLPFDRIDGESG